MKLIIFIAIIFLYSNFTKAEEMQEMFGMASYYQFKTDDAEALVPAMQAYSASKCRKNVPAQIRLMAEHFNGDGEATHTVIYGVASPTDLQKTFQVQGSCPEFARLWSVISKHTTPTSQSLGMLLASGGDPTKDGVYQIWQMRISDEAKYVAEYKKMQAARDEAGQINGGWGLVRLMAGSNEDYTHFAFQGSPDLSTHVTPVADNSIYMKFSQKVSDIREIHRINMNFVAADL